jgi:type II secretory pathway pseudopilin PulG
MIELVVAMFLAILVVGASALLFVNSTDSSLASQRQYSVVSVLQQQMEKMRDTIDQYGFSALAMTATPTGVTLTSDPTNPDAFVSGTGCSATFQVLANYNSTAESFSSGSSIPDDPEPLVVNGCTVAGASISGGQITPVQYADLVTGQLYTSTASIPGCSSVPVDCDPYATLYTFVTQTTEAGCSSTATNACAADARRVVIAAVLSAATTDIGTNFPTYSTTVFTNPVASDAPSASSGLRVLGVIS